MNEPLNFKSNVNTFQTSGSDFASEQQNSSTSTNSVNIDLNNVAAVLNSWRKNKKSRFEPLPESLKFLVYQLLSSHKYNKSTIIKELNISANQLKIIKTQFNTNSEQSKNNDILELLPFELVHRDTTQPKSNATSHNANFIHSTNNNHHSLQNHHLSNNNSSAINQNHSIKYISINKANGESLSIPNNLNPDIVYNIIQLFLCSK